MGASLAHDSPTSYRRPALHSHAKLEMKPQWNINIQPEIGRALRGGICWLADHALAVIGGSYEKKIYRGSLGVSMLAFGPASIS